MSYWEHRKPVRRTRAVDTQVMAGVAVDLLDRAGLRGLTIRAVARRLDVAPASLYSRLTSVDDLFDLALDEALGRDESLQRAAAQGRLHPLIRAYYRHLVRHPWACQVIAMRAPRGPHHLRLSERLCVLLAEDGAADPLADAYTLSNFAIGCATTTPTAVDERATAVDADTAPLYASLHASHRLSAEAVFDAGIRALLHR